MTFELELTEEQHQRICDSTERRDEAALREVLSQAVEGVVQKLMREPAEAPDDEFEALADRLAASFTASPSHLPLPEAALARASIYDDRR